MQTTSDNRFLGRLSPCAPFGVGVIIILLLLGLTSIGQVEAQQNLSLDFPSGHISLMVKVNIFEKSTKNNYKYHMRQTYSSIHLQSKTEYYSEGKALRQLGGINLPDDGIIYIIGDQSVVLHKSNRACSNYDSSLVQDFLLPKGMTLSSKKLHQSIQGPMRLLFYMALNRAKLSFSSEGQDMARNVEVRTYTYQHEGLDIYVQYSAKIDDRSLPIRIQVEANDYQYIYEYIAIDIDEKIETLSWTASDSPQLDPVAIEPGYNCQFSALKNLKLNQRDFGFSFKAIAQEPDYPQFVEISTAFESSLGCLRIDRGPSRNMPKPISAIIDFSFGRGYIVPNYQEFPSKIGPPGDYYKQSNARPCLKINQPAHHIPTLGEILLGSDDNFSFLGFARVRGMRTRVYEGKSSTWPRWVQNPLYFSDKNAFGIENSEKFGIFDKLERLVTIIYLRDDGKMEPNDNDLSSIQLVHIELYRITDGQRFFVDKIAIQVTEFQWSIPVKTAENQRAEDLFSLVDLCPPQNQDRNHYARVEMTLSTLEQVLIGPKNDWLFSTFKRNLAILAAIQLKLFYIPVTSIAELESKLIYLEDPKLMKGKSNFKLMISFELARESPDLTDLELLGRNNVMPELEDKLMVLHHLEPLQCLYMAASNFLRDTYMGYSAYGNKCLIGKSRFDRTLSGANSNDIEVFQEMLQFNPRYGDYYVFKVKHKASKDDSIVRLVHGSDRSRFFEHDFKVPLVYGNESSPIIFGDLSMNVHEINEKNTYQLDNQRQEDTNKFNGLGLVANDPQARIVSSESLEPVIISKDSNQAEVEELSEVTFAQCQAACLADFECKSYSVCLLAGGRLECILSKVNFRDPLVVINLMDIQLKRLAYNEQVQLEVKDVGSIRVRKNPHCELHNKIYLNLFDSDSLVSRTINGNQLIYPVSGRESCARYCFEKTLNAFKDEARPKHQISMDLLRKPDSDPDSVLAAVKEHRENIRNQCNYMLYMDATQLTRRTDQVKEYFRSHLAKPNSNPVTTGYCLIEAALGRPLVNNSVTAESLGVDEKLKNDLNSLMMERYRLRMEIFFEQKAGVRLSNSEFKTDEEARAFEKIRIKGKLSSRQEFDLVRSYIDRGDNNRQILDGAHSISECAHACLAQFKTPWPACKSFDVLIYGSGMYRKLYCEANTITLSEAIKYERVDLIDSSKFPMPNVQFLHFEPRPGFINNMLNEEKHLWLAESGLLESIAFGLHSFGVLLLISVSLIGGLLFGLKLGLVYMDRQNVSESLITQSEDDHPEVRERPTVEFKNLVTFEGVISGQEQQQQLQQPPQQHSQVQ